MNRRKFIGLLGVSAAVPMVVANAQGKQAAVITGYVQCAECMNALPVREITTQCTNERCSNYMRAFTVRPSKVYFDL